MPVLEQSAMDWEWLIFDDHSEDNTFSVATQMAQKNPRIRCARMAKNYGFPCTGFIWFSAGTRRLCRATCRRFARPAGRHYRDDCGNAKWRAYRFGIRAPNDMTRPLKKILAKCYYFSLRYIFGIRNMPPNGGDLMLAQRCVLNELKQLHGENINFLATLAQLGLSAKICSRRATGACARTRAIILLPRI